MLYSRDKVVTSRIYRHVQAESVNIRNQPTKLERLLKHPADRPVRRYSVLPAPSFPRFLVLDLHPKYMLTAFLLLRVCRWCFIVGNGARTRTARMTSRLSPSAKIAWSYIAICWSGHVGRLEKLLSISLWISVLVCIYSFEDVTSSKTMLF